MKAEFVYKKPKEKITPKQMWVRITLLLISSFLLAFFIKLTGLGVDKINEVVSPKSLMEIALIFIVNVVLLAIILFATKYVKHDAMSRDKMFAIVCTSLVLTFFASWGFAELINVYIAPLLLGSLLIATLVDKRLGILTQFFVSNMFFLISILWDRDIVIVSENVGAIITSLVSSIIIVLLLSKSATRLKFTIVGIVVALGSAFIPMLVHLAAGIRDAYTILVSGVWSIISIVLSVSIYTLILPIMEYAFRVNTVFILSELCSLETPLLKRLVQEAPGTFNHSLVVGNLAELCADAIDEDTQLAKAAAYYHDIGKIENPEYFVENQKGVNPHDDIIPEVSVYMIVNHVTAGREILKKARVPDIIADIAVEHHGTTPVNYFLYKAQSYTEDELDKIEYSYPGPKPKSKIAAIIMIADTVEAASRARGNFDDIDEFRKFVRKLIKSKADADQFSDCPITFEDLKKIEDVLVEAVPSMYHARIKYDNDTRKKK
ncbi:MAG TPA: HDIG domain-containing protein [Clostridia bacterium]|jgi:hypothetical protein|nr:HDIG domain-containing protein [Clostridia bacterium]